MGHKSKHLWRRNDGTSPSATLAVGLWRSSDAR